MRQKQKDHNEMKQAADSPAAIQKLRQQIDVVDNQIIRLLSRRFHIRQMGILKINSSSIQIPAGKQISTVTAPDQGIHTDPRIDLENIIEIISDTTAGLRCQKSNRLNLPYRCGRFGLSGHHWRCIILPVFMTAIPRSVKSTPGAGNPLNNACVKITFFLAIPIGQIRSFLKPCRPD
jgi:hypothetical protein